MSASGEFCWERERDTCTEITEKHKTCGFTFLVWRVSNPIFLLQCEVSINQKILWNGGLIETLTSEHTSACKCLGQCGKVSGVYRRKALLDVSVKKSMNFRMNNGTANNEQRQCWETMKWMPCGQWTGTIQTLNTRQQTTQSVKIAVCESRAVLPAL